MSSHDGGIKEGQTTKQKEGKNMNPLIQFKKTLMLPLLTALALVVGAVSARATPACGLSTMNWRWNTIRLARST
jgi:hypothetical protein